MGTQGNIDYKELAESLLKKHKSGTTTKKEQLLLQRWLAQYESQAAQPEIPKRYLSDMQAEILAKISAQPAKTFRFRPWQYAAAAALLIFASMLGYFYLKPLGPEARSMSVALQADSISYHNDAVLLLSDGSSLNFKDTSALKSAIPGIQIDEQNAIISFLEVQLQPRTSTEDSFHTIHTPNGAACMVVLPDGTYVRLSGNSSLRFAKSFRTRRHVEIIGEAFLDVKRDVTRKFIVDAGYQQLEVLGTSFNVKNYPEERITSTSLVEGSLRVATKNSSESKYIILKPGEMAVNGPQQLLHIKQFAAARTKAWHEGEIYFDGENLEQVLAIIARRYDVKIIYEFKPSPDVTYGGVISRERKLSTVLSLLEEKENLHIDIVGKEVIVRKAKEY